MKTKQDWTALGLIVLSSVMMYLIAALLLTSAWYLVNSFLG